MRNILIILAALVGFGAFAQTNIPTRSMLADTNGVVKWPSNITRIRIGGTDYTNLLGFGLSVTNGQLSVDTTQLPEGSGGSSLITSVGTDFEVSGGALNVTNTIGTGPLVRQSEAGSGGGGTNFINAVSADFEVLTQSLSLTNTTGTGALLRASSLSPYLLSATAASTYATLESPSFTGTVSFETIQADEVQVPFANLYASANSSSNLTGTLDGGSWTNLNGTEIRSGTVADARIDSAIARVSALSAYQPLDADLTSLAAGTAMATAITNAASVGAPSLIVGSTNVAVAIAAKAPLASPAFTTSATIGGTNVLDYAATHLTEAEASALYQRTNSTLTRVAGIGAGTTGDLLYRDATGWTNLAKGTQGQYLAVTATVPAWSNAPSGGGTTISTNGARTGALVAYQLDGSLATTNVAIFSTNTALGIRAGSGLSSGNFNTFIGYNTATNVTSGNSSVIIGYQAGKDAANAISFTTILGTAAGSTVTADYNTLLGYHAGNLLVSGGNNVSVGYQSGNNTTNGSDNVFVGSQAGTGSGSGSRNTFVGRQAGNANTTANDNVYVGYQAGLLSTTSDANTFVGVEAGETLTAGANNNTFVGYRSGRVITSGYNNTFLGYGSGNTHTIGNNNIFLGINVNGNTNTANHFLAGGSGQPITSVYFGEGIADASPSSFALRATSGTGTDIAGAGITIAGGQSTGSGAGGSLTFQTSPAGSTGTTTNALVTALLIGSDGKLSVTKTITAAGTTSVQTINKVAGSVNLAAAATSVVVTNSLVSTSSVVIGTVASNDTTAKSAAIVPGSGLFTIYLNAAATAETRVNWIVLN